MRVLYSSRWTETKSFHVRFITHDMTVVVFRAMPLILFIANLLRILFQILRPSQMLAILFREWIEEEQTDVSKKSTVFLQFFQCIVECLMRWWLVI